MPQEKPLTVNQLTKYIRRKFRADPYIYQQNFWLQGELTNFHLRSRNQYFSLKDDNSDLPDQDLYQIDAVMFAREFSKLKFTPENGMKVLVYGHVDVYPNRGSYQFYVSQMEVTGTGSLEIAFRQMYAKLKKEGLFDRPKKSIPPFPKRVAIVTSNDAAVKHDMITTFRRRNPLIQLVFYPTKVQGDDAAPMVAKQIRRANEDGNFDVLIVARGGGSRADLWTFNEEVVGRAIADSNIPVISSVGHEVDTTIADLAADDREATPTSAAVKASAWLLDDVLAQIRQYQQQLYVSCSNIIQQAQTRLDALQNNYVFQQPDRLFNQYQQQVDDLRQNLRLTFNALLVNKQNQLDHLQARLNQNAPRVQLVRDQAKLQHLQTQLAASLRTKLQRNQAALQGLQQQLIALNPTTILSRGYSYVTLDGQVVKQISQLHPSDRVRIHLSDGIAEAEIKLIQKDGKQDGNH
ncbi:MAG TPA: exodeoxyribonuclease VII large subunit [Candidatus Limosilactobacillus merdigallinarum]|uniref:Exodeoxyribonuclease 7 large subunit n=1 Tax=Candidatus Limosilactobacillus merdigallinarum TaxID=2838652 RepID=A0A9D2AJY5_9LACO|nr:exodeoxyribonuclease VII large subunit [Candidatus Limosilactobacillus merdigallinarum]